MSIYAISDLHLSKINPKPMDIFGNNWANHWEKICWDWSLKVNTSDIVLIPGDISWALTLDEALPDIIDISMMTGRKVLLRGNHDYWWESPTKIRKVLPDNIDIIQNDFVDLDEFIVCGTRGWMLPGDDRFKENDIKIFRREIIRLDMSLSKAVQSTDKPIIAMIHYPPFNEKGEPSEFVEVMERYKVKLCVYGHLHGESAKNVTQGMHYGIQFYMVSCDYLDFKLKKIW